MGASAKRRPKVQPSTLVLPPQWVLQQYKHFGDLHWTHVFFICVLHTSLTNHNDIHISPLSLTHTLTCDAEDFWKPKRKAFLFYCVNVVWEPDLTYHYTKEKTASVMVPPLHQSMKWEKWSFCSQPVSAKSKSVISSFYGYTFEEDINLPFFQGHKVHQDLRRTAKKRVWMGFFCTGLWCASK